MDIRQGSVSQVSQALRRAAIETRYAATRPLEKAAAASTEDRLEISADGRELARLRASLLTQARDLSETRELLVAQARRRVATGFYDGEGIVAQISERMLQQTTLGEVSTTELTSTGAAPGTPAAAETGYRTDLMREVNEKIHSGFYSDQDVMRFVADRLMGIYQIQPQDGEQ